MQAMKQSYCWLVFVSAWCNLILTLLHCSSSDSLLAFHGTALLTRTRLLVPPLFETTSSQIVSKTENAVVNHQRQRVLPSIHLPRHPTHEGVNELLERAEQLLASVYESSTIATTSSTTTTSDCSIPQGKSNNFCKHFFQLEKVFANSYVDLSKIEMIGFDFDYTLVTYTNDLLSTIYDQALQRLVQEKQYPVRLQETLTGKFDPFFSIRGLAVDKETGWIAHLRFELHSQGRRGVGRTRESIQ